MKDAIAALLRRWQAGTADPAAIKRMVEESAAGATASALPPETREALAELDLLEVHLLTVADVPALLALLDGGDDAVATWRRYREAIDLDARSKALRKNPFYRPFCR